MKDEEDRQANDVLHYAFLARVGRHKQKRGFCRFCLSAALYYIIGNDLVGADHP
jgi:hypothetical protein